MSNSSSALSLWDLVVAAFDRARTVTDDPEIAARLAARTMGRWLGRAERARQLQQRAQRPARRVGRVTRHDRAA